MVTNSQKSLVDYVESGSGTPLVLLPAFPLSAKMWKAQIDSLSDTFRVIAVNPRGFGGSPPLGEAPASLDVVADDVNALLDHLAIEKAVIGGLSLGGYETLAFLSKYPNRVAGALLADTRASADTPAGREIREHDARLVETAMAGGSSEELEAVKFKVAYGRMLEPNSPTAPALVAQLRDWVRETRPESIAWALRAMANRPDTHGALSRLTVPVLVVAGERDQVIPRAATEELFSAVPEGQGRLELVPEADHLSNLERPEAFTRAVRAFGVEAFPHSARRYGRHHSGWTRPAEERGFRRGGLGRPGTSPGRVRSVFQ